MASSSGNTTTGSGNGIQNSGWEGDMHMQMDERKRKRMLSNRESARRSRMKKQKHLDELTSQISELRTDNHRILSTINVTSQQYLNVEAENSVLRAQMGELTQRLESLNEIVNYMSTLPAGVVNSVDDDNGWGIMGDFGILEGYIGNNHNNNNNNPWGMGYLNQPIVADVLQY